MATINKKKILSFAVIVVFFTALICLSFFGKTSQQKNIENNNYVIDYVIKYVTVAGQKIKVDLASTDATREQGLSGRAKLADGTGMLFIFDQPGIYSFWMKDMNFPIDMIWLSDDLRIVYIKKDAKPELYPEAYGSDNDAKYVLEVVSGFSDKNNLQIEDRVEFIY